MAKNCMEPGRKAGRFPLDLTGQANAIDVKPNAAPSFDAALPPVPGANLQAVLDHDLAAAEKEGALAPATGAGVTIGVLKGKMESGAS
jgi:D-alanyl-D-alanine-carboxypeptidase/D-alanyl-D-alanine-endopeptidase